jgi:hypothetical protein
VIADLRDLARAHAPEAIEELARLAIKGRSEAARVAAIRELLDRGYGKPTQFIAGDEKPELGPLTIEVVFVKPKPQLDEDRVILNEGRRATDHTPI